MVVVKKPFCEHLAVVMSRHEQFVAELHKRYDGFRSERPIPGPPSLSDLRGFGGHTGEQIIGSLNSDFLGVAEHLQENHPGLVERYAFF